MPNKSIYQVVCFDPLSKNKDEFILGTYINPNRAREVKDEVENQAIEDGKILEYKVNEYVILDWEEK